MSQRLGPICVHFLPIRDLTPTLLKDAEYRIVPSASNQRWYGDYSVLQEEGEERRVSPFLMMRSVVGYTAGRHSVAERVRVSRMFWDADRSQRR